MVDLVELYAHWYAGRSITEVADSLGVDRKTVRKYVAVATSAGLSPGGPAISDTEWRTHLRIWFPKLVDTRLRQPSWGEIARHHDYIKDLVGVVPVSVIHQRLSDEAGLSASVATVRRYVGLTSPKNSEQARWSCTARPSTMRVLTLLHPCSRASARAKLQCRSFRPPTQTST